MQNEDRDRQRVACWGVMRRVRLLPHWFRLGETRPGVGQRYLVVQWLCWWVELDRR